MKILILGGTRFIGRHITETLLAAGHQVTIFTRGKSPDELPPEVERLHGDRDEGSAGLAALRGRSWDACVDTSGYTPRQVRPSAEMLCPVVKRYVFISTVSVYGDLQERPVHEHHPRLQPAGEDVTEVVGELYGRLKVTCEDILQTIYASRCTLLRPQIVVGPHDPTGRYPYWVQRASLGGEMLAPGDGSDHLQVIDVRDLARFVRTVIEKGLGGPFNLAGHRINWAEFMKILEPKGITWVPAQIIESADTTEFHLPLFRPEHGPFSGLMEVNNNRARSAGLTLTNPEVTMQDTRKWLRSKPLIPALFPPEREKELIRLTRQTGD